MRFIIGPPPDDTDFDPKRGGWQRLREMGPRTLMIIGSLAGVPLAALCSFAWLRISGTAVTYTIPIDAMTAGRWTMLLLPLVILLFGGVFLACLIFVHELIHCLACPGFGLTSATVLGVWPSKLFPYGNHSGPVSLRRFIFVGCAPFLILSVAPWLLAFVGGPHWPLLTFISVMNALVCGGDAMICGMLLYQLPLRATLRNKGWDTWWRIEPMTHNH